MIHENIELTGSFTVSGSFVLPSHSSGSAVAETGSLYHDSVNGILKVYTGTQWVTVGEQTGPGPDTSQDIEYLLVAGGGAGAGGQYNSGGGGAGGLLSSSLASVESGSTFTITIGGGGTGGTSQGADGTNSSIAGASITTLTGIGGGGGGSHPNNPQDGRSGGSGGGGSQGASVGGSGTNGQGNDGGGQWYAAGAGGGGAGQAGSTGTGNTGPYSGGQAGVDGGDGNQSGITGTLTYYAGGGGGGLRTAYGVPRGNGGEGGGGQGGPDPGNGGAATANTGGGGGGSGGNNTSTRSGGSGGSGVAIFAYDSGSLSGLGGVKSSRSDGYVVHTFNESGTLTIGGPNDNPIIPQNNFNALVYTGNHTYPRNVDVGFVPDLVWVKNNGTGHHWRWFDITRGTAPIYPNNTGAEDSYNDGPEMIVNGHANGFTIIDNPDGSNPGGYGVNENSSEIAAYCWKGGPTGSNSDGNIASTVSVNNSAGFSIVSYTGNLSTATTATAQSVGHGLDQAPEIIFFLNRGGATQRVAGTFGSNWSDLLPLPGTAAAKTNYYATYPMADPTDTVFYTNYISAINVNTNNHVAYCFHSVPGFSKIGTYTGTAGPNNQIDVGFKPKMVIIKSLAAQDWNVFDAARETSNPKNYALKLNSSATEATEAAFVINFNSTGFELDGSGGAGGEGQINASTSTYLYLAFAE